jgi:uncharacterized membrane protein
MITKYHLLAWLIGLFLGLTAACIKSVLDDYEPSLYAWIRVLSCVVLFIISFAFLVKFFVD